MSQLTHLDSETLQNIVCRLPFQNVFRLVYMSGQKRLGQMASVLLRHVNLLSLPDISCFARLRWSGGDGLLAYHDVVSLHVDLPPKSQYRFRTLPNNLQRFCNTRHGFVLEIDNPSQLTDIDVYNVTISGGGTLENLRSIKIREFKSAFMIQHVENLAISYDDWLASLQQGLVWPNLHRLSLIITRSTYHTYREGQAYSSKSQICPSLKRLSLKVVDATNPVQCFLECPAMANLLRLSISFVNMSAYVAFFSQTDFAALGQLTHLKVCCSPLNARLSITSLPPRLKILHLVGMNDPAFPESHPTLHRVISGKNEHIRNQDGTWWNLKDALLDKSNNLDRLLSRSTLLYNAFTKGAIKKRKHICLSSVQYIFDIGRLDIATPLFLALGNDKYWWSRLLIDHYKQRLACMPIEKYSIRVLWQLRLCFDCLLEPAANCAEAPNLIREWIHDNVIAQRFDARLLQHLLWMMRWMSKRSNSSNQLAQTAEEFTEISEPKLEPNVATSFNIAFCSSNLRMEQFERAFKMADDYNFCKSCCEGTADSAWFDKYPLMRNVTLVQKKLGHLLSKKMTIHPSQRVVSLCHEGGGFTIDVTKKNVTCFNSFVLTRLDLGDRLQSIASIKKLAKQVKNQFQ